MPGAPAPDPTVATYDALAPVYDETVSVDPGDRVVRTVFQAEVSARVPAGGRVLDFGCGTGTDARYYVERGYRVHAYDVAPQMIAVLRAKCARLIEEGRIHAWHAPASDFARTVPTNEPFDVVAANFGVLNSVAPDELAPLFRTLATVLRPGGWLLACLHNPLYWKDALRPRHWPALVRQLRTGEVSSATASMRTYHHPPARLARAAAPGLVLRWHGSLGALISYKKGDGRWGEGASLRARLEKRLWRTFPVSRVGRFVLVGLERGA